MSRRNIDKWSLGYLLLQIFWGFSNFRLYYKKIRTYNEKNIPENSSVIVAPNHQNALMDALAFATQPFRQRIFLTRADVFNKPLIERILYFIKMLPIYRIRDGRESLKKNEEIFNKATSILFNKRCHLFMFPEGNHGDKRRLRPLVKGIFRIAFLAQEKYKNKPGVKILPVGLDYEDYQKYNKELLINYGEPIEVSEFWDEYERDPASATNALRERLMAEMRKTMIDIQSEDYYETVMELRSIYRPTLIKKLKLNSNNMLHKFQADKKLIKALAETEKNSPEAINKIDKLTKEYVELRSNLKLREWVLRKKGYSYVLSIIKIIICILFSPVLIFGLLSNLPNFFIPMQFAKKIKDTQFRSTAAFGMGMIIETVYHIILLIVGIIFLPNIWLKILLIPAMALSGKAAFKIWKAIIKNIVRIRYNLNRRRNQKYMSAIEKRNNIIAELNNLSIETY